METGVCWWTNSKKRHKSCDLECLLIKYSQQGWFPSSCCIPETYTMLYVNYISRKPRGKFALEGKVLTSGPPGKSHNSAFNTPHWSAFLHILWALASNSAFLCTVLHILHIYSTYSSLCYSPQVIVHGGEGNGNPLQFLPGEFHGQRSLAGYSPWSRKELDTTERLTHTHT